MLTDPIEVGETYRTRSGKEVVISSRTTWSTESMGSKYAVFFPWELSKQCVYGEGPFAGKPNPHVDGPSDLVERITFPVRSTQLDLFDF